MFYLVHIDVPTQPRYIIVSSDVDLAFRPRHRHVHSVRVRVGAASLHEDWERHRKKVRRGMPHLNISK